MRLIDFFDKGFEQNPDRPFLVQDGVATSFREVRCLSFRIANALSGLGVLPGTKVAVFSQNSSRAFECLIGLLRAGCVWCSVNTRSTVEDNIYVLNNFDIEVLLFSADLHASVEQIRAASPKIRHFICIDGDPRVGTTFDAWIGSVSDNYVDIDRGPNDIATLLSSGGTSGKPKGVQLSNLNCEIAFFSFSGVLQCKDPVHLVVAPMTHAAGVVTLALMRLGTTNIILPSFDPERVLDAIEKHRVTHLFLPPTAIYMLLDHPGIRERDFSSLKYLLYAAAPMSVSRLKEAIDVFGPVLCQGYAQMEALLHLTFMSPEDHLVVGDPKLEHRLASCGKPGPLVRLEIMDDEGRVLGPNVHGEIVVKSNLVMAGYYKNPAETAAVSKFGWHHTGDVGYRDEDGWVYIVDRKKDMIISGGFNIYPNEIEQVISEHSAVEVCAVIGVPDEKWGEAVKAIIKIKRGATLDTAELEALCRRKLAAFKVPKSFEIWPDLPRSAAGKLLRRVIRETFWKDMARRV